MPRVSRTIFALAALGAVSLSACGAESSREPSDVKSSASEFADLPGGKILDAAVADMGKVRAVRIRGKITQDGERISLDIRTDQADRCAGTIGVDKGEARIIATKKAAYVKGNAAFWKQDSGEDPTQVLDYLDGRWAKIAAADELRALCTLGRTFLDQASTGSSWGIKVSEVQPFDGHDVIALSAASGKENAEFLVSADAPHYIRKLVIDSADVTGEIVLSAFGAKGPIDVPATGEYVDLG